MLRTGDRAACWGAPKLAVTNKRLVLQGTIRPDKVLLAVTSGVVVRNDSLHNSQLVILEGDLCIAGFYYYFLGTHE